MKSSILHIAVLVCSIALLSACSTTHPKQATPEESLHFSKEDYLLGNYNEAYQHALVSAEAGNAQAQYDIGYFLYYGLGVKRDQKQAVVWFEKSANQEDKSAVAALGMIHESTQHQAEKATSKPQKKQTSARKTSKLEKTILPIKKATANIRYYTVQLIANRDRKELTEYLSRFKLLKTSHITQQQRNGEAWFVATTGQFKDKHAAVAHLKTLPKGILANHPWVILIRQR